MNSLPKTSRSRSSWSDYALPVARQEFPGLRRKAPRLCPHKDRCLFKSARPPPASRPHTPHSRPHDGDPAPGGPARPLFWKPAPLGLQPDTRKAKSPSGRRVPSRPARPRPCSRPVAPTRGPAGAAHLAQLLAAHGAVALLAQHPHLGGAAVAHRVVAAAQRRGLQVPAAQHAAPAAPLRCRHRRLQGRAPSLRARRRRHGPRSGPLPAGAAGRGTDWFPAGPPLPGRRHRPAQQQPHLAEVSSRLPPQRGAG